jgi:hypothetical protein
MDCLTIDAVANVLERSHGRILEALQFGELPAIWQGRELVIPAAALPPYRAVSEEEG